MVVKELDMRASRSIVLLSWVIKVSSSDFLIFVMALNQVNVSFMFYTFCERYACEQVFLFSLLFYLALRGQNPSPGSIACLYELIIWNNAIILEFWMAEPWEYYNVAHLVNCIQNNRIKIPFKTRFSQCRCILYLFVGWMPQLVFSSL